MKKYLSMFIALFMILVFSAAFADDDLGVQIIGEQQVATAAADEELSLDDIQLGKVYKISGNAIVAPRSFQFVDCFAQYTKDSDYSYQSLYGWDQRHKGRVYTYAYSWDRLHQGNWSPTSLTENSAVWMDAGPDNQFVWFRIDITNVNYSVKDLSKAIVVKVVYANEFEFGGWIRLIDSSKIDLKYSDGAVSRFDYELTQHPSQIVMHPENAISVGYMQTGYYAIGCTLPKYVIQDESELLRVEIEINGETLTYNIRKYPLFDH